MASTQPDNEAIFHAERDIPESDSRREYVREACGAGEAQIGPKDRHFRQAVAAKPPG